MITKLIKKKLNKLRFAEYKRDSDFRILYKKAKQKLKNAKIKKEERSIFIKDLSKCNNIELMHYLATAAVFPTAAEYVDVINKWLTMETVTFDYLFDLKYEGENMEQITKLITLMHRKIDLEKEIFE